MTITLEDLSGLSVTLNETNVTCNGADNGEVISQISGGTSPYAFAWSNGETSNEITGLSPGQYGLTVTDVNGCEASATTTINEPSLLVVAGNPSHLLCNDSNDGTIDITPTGGLPPYDFNWNDGALVEDRTGLSAGSYSVIVTDGFGCTATYSTTLTEPDALYVTNDNVDPTCNDEDNGAINIVVNGGTSDYTYIWNTGDLTTTVSDISAGIYSVTVTDENNCSIIETIELLEPDVLLANGSDDVMIDSMAVTTIMVNPAGGVEPYTYNWSNGLDNTETSHDVSPESTTTYSVTVTDANNCVDVATIMVSLNP